MRNGYIVISQTGPSDDWQGFYKDLGRAMESVSKESSDFKEHCALVEVRAGAPIFRDDGTVWLLENGGWVKRIQENVFGKQEKLADALTEATNLRIENTRLHARIAELQRHQDPAAGE